MPRSLLLHLYLSKSTSQLGRREHRLCGSYRRNRPGFDAIRSLINSLVYTVLSSASASTANLFAGCWNLHYVAVGDHQRFHPGATIYYTTNGTTPTTSSSVYSGPITVSSTETIRAIAVASGYSNSSVASATYTINATPATPTFSVAPGTYASAQTVSISDATPGATIYYTKNGTTPTTSSTEYTGAITVSSTETLEAVATVGDPTMSAVASATYVIESPNINYPSGGFKASSFDLNGGAAITSGGLLQLTDGGGDEGRSAWFATKVPVQTFTTDFTFQLMDAQADGFAFVIQNAGPTALGAAGGGLGYLGIPQALPSSSISTTTRAKDRTRPDSILTAPRPWFPPSTSPAPPSTCTAAIPSPPTSPTTEQTSLLP